MRVAVCQVRISGAVRPPRLPGGDVTMGGEDRSRILAGSKPCFEVPVAFQVWVLDLAVEPGQHDHQLTI